MNILDFIFLSHVVSEIFASAPPPRGKYTIYLI